MRGFDLALAILFMPIFVPFMLLAVIAIKIEAPRSPVFFSQIRYGFEGRPFKIYKLRTMVPEAEALKTTLVDLSVDKDPGFKIVGDPRITKVGRWLRKAYIDEMPQLMNVLRGEMAIVGPRANSYSPDKYEPWQRIRLQVKPGITGSWQIAPNKPYDFDARCRMDAEYVSNKSLGTDIRIVLKTVTMCLSSFSGE